MPLRNKIYIIFILVLFNPLNISANSNFDDVLSIDDLSIPQDNVVNNEPIINNSKQLQNEDNTKIENNKLPELIIDKNNTENKPINNIITKPSDLLTIPNKNSTENKIDNISDENIAKIKTIESINNQEIKIQDAENKTNTTSNSIDNNSNKKEEFEGLINIDKSNKMLRPINSKIDKTEIYYQTNPYDVWKDSVMFSKDDINKLQTSLIIFLQNSIIDINTDHVALKIKKETEAKNNTKKTIIKEEMIIKLNSILFINNENWAIWLNGHQYSNDKKIDQYLSKQGIEILKIYPDCIEINLDLKTSYMTPDDIDKQPALNQVTYNDSNSSVKIKLYINQYFTSKYMSVLEGNINNTKIIPNDKTNKNNKEI